MDFGIFEDAPVLVTGGAGFLGSNLARELARLGARVTVLDNLDPMYGGNPYNLTNTTKPVRFVEGSILDRELVTRLCSDSRYVFHFAAQCSHVDSMTDPWSDIRLNCEGMVSLLEGVKASLAKPIVVFANTRAVLGAPLELPANEFTLPNPTDIYGVNKLAAEWYGAVYARAYGIGFVSLRLTNCFGPRHQMRNGKYGILNWFLSLALQGKPIKVFGTGSQLRDYLYVDDATEGFLRAADFCARLREGRVVSARVQLSGEKIPFAVFNLGSGIGRKFVDCARAVAEVGGGSIEFVPWPPDRAVIETGDFAADYGPARDLLEWCAKVSFEEGLEKTAAYYREHLERYLS